jgi:hypothetical protein
MIILSLWYNHLKILIMANNKHIWEGWTVQSFIDELQPSFDMIMTGQSWCKPFTDAIKLKEWCKDNQPYYKKHIPEVFNHFKKQAKL